MKNNKRFLTCTLGLMLGVGLLVGCGEKTVEHTVTFYHGNEELKSEVVKHGEKCPEYTPEAKEGYTFMGWYENRQHSGDPFNFDTPIEVDLDLYAWYKENFKPTTDKYYVVGNIWGEDHWDGQAGTAYEDWKDREMTLVEAELANSKNVFEYTMPEAKEAVAGNKFRMIKAVAGEDGAYASEGWVDTFGFTSVDKVLDAAGAEVAKEEYIYDEDSHNIGLAKGGRIKVTMDVTDPTAIKTTLQFLTVAQVEAPEFVSLIGAIASESANWDKDIDLVASEDGMIWEGDVALTDGDEFKVRMNHDWGVSYGAANLRNASEGISGTDNILVSVTATYHITVDIINRKLDVVAKEGTVVVNPLLAVYEAAVDADVEFDAVYVATHGKYNFFANGTKGIVVYQNITLPDGVVAGSVCHVVGKVAVYKGLVQVTGATVTASEAKVTAKLDTVYNGEAFAKTDLGKKITVKGKVVDSYTANGTSNATVKLLVGEKELNVYINKEIATLDYEALTAALVKDAEVELQGYVSIFDGAAEVDYATSTGYQLVFPSVVVKAAA